MVVKVDLLIVHADQVVTTVGASDQPLAGSRLGDLVVIPDGAVAVTGKEIVAVGDSATVLDQVQVTAATQVLEAKGRVVLPGLVDPHTHLVFAGSRERELEMRLAGKAYLDILAAGGGILNTVKATRAASPEALYHQAHKSLDTMLCHGTTTIEAKSGYGLDTPTEVKQLAVAQRLDRDHPMEIVSTFLGAHAIPPEYKGRSDEFVDLICREMLPAVAAQGLAQYCDVFCEEGVFSVPQSRRILQTAKKQGFGLKLHADEIVPLGGAELAAEVGAISGDHLLAASEAGLLAMKKAGVMAVLLPGTSFYLMSERNAPARKLVGFGLPLALATDFNPGSCPTESLQIIMNLACLNLRLTPAQVIAAVTINAAHALGRAQQVGSLEVGKQADLAIFTASDYRYILYRFGTNLVDKVVKRGKLVVDGGKIVGRNS